MFSHASVRMRYETKNGATMRSRKKFRQRPARNAIQYTSGYASRRAAVVASPAYRNERPSCVR
jgi:hypothetical protein